MAKAKTSIPNLKAALSASLKDKFDGTGVTVGTIAEIGYLAEVKNWVPTGIYALDFALSYGRGFACGRVAEVFGPEHAGKTALCEYMAARFLQTYGTQPHWLDFEKSYDEDHMEGYGVNAADVFAPDTPTLENGWDYIGATLHVLDERRVELAKAKQDEDPPVLIVLDSIAQAVPKAELEEETAEDKHMAETARAMSKGFRKYIRPISAANVVLLFTNQIRDKMNARPGQKQTDTPGGRAVKFGCSTRMEVVATEPIKGKGDVVIGHVAKVTMVKARHSAKRLTAEFVLSYRRGVDPAWSNFLWFKEHGYIQPAGTSGYRWKGVDKPFRRPEFGLWAKENDALVQDAVKAIYAKLLARMDADQSATDLSDDDEDAPSKVANPDTE